MARKETPLMQQYNRVKTNYPDTLLLFRVGDFYETFGQDAITAAKVLDIVLTKRGNGSASEIELAGFPYHSLDNYLPRLVRAGHRVAVCDQLEDPKQAVGIVKRGVTELVTPGVSYHDQVLQARSNNYLAAVHWTKKGCGIALLDISTGDFSAAQGSPDLADRLLRAHQPSELLFAKPLASEVTGAFGNDWQATRLDDWVFQTDYAEERIHKQFESDSIKGFGFEASPLAIIAAGAILHYLEHAQHDRPKHVRHIHRLTEDGTLWLDRFTIRNLELIHPSQPDGRSLVDTMDRTGSPMGARCLRRWLLMPLTAALEITKRHEAVESFLEDDSMRAETLALMRGVGDLERLASKASSGRINPRELVQLRNGLSGTHSLAGITEGQPALLPYLERLTPCDDLLDRLSRELEDDAPISVSKGSVIKKGVHAELDELRQLRSDAKGALAAVCAREIERTGIASLKIDYNQVFGYYLEVRHKYKDQVPPEWIRKQTLTQAERYITEELKDLESRILEAQEKTGILEQQCYDSLVQGVGNEIGSLQENALIIGHLDVLASLADLAQTNGYVRPRMHEEHGIRIANGRHPVIEKALPPGESYIANDVTLDAEQAQILMITGPNMAGKSALLRQTAIISLMAQMGSFVPASSADLGILDRIFTRVGASDNISSGESTFMVEMNETSAILNNLSERSLILLDEIGRGTSTYDGVSIAWAIAEYLHQHPTYRPLTLFATHYHELNAMQEHFPRIRNFNVSVREVDQQIVFLRKLVAGGSNHSFGIHVAQLAGMPRSIVKRAEAVLKQLESNRNRLDQEGATDGAAQGPNVQDANLSMASDVQLSFFQLDDPVLEQVREQIMDLDIENLTPIDALMKLHEIKKSVSGSKEYLKKA
ncbi:MAG: DNA mismatch repair protein MutS [Flavobacteriales bacterium]|nr:DNA mismatch repair protein MutS [Flavobacteriales bacterium]